MVMSKRLPSVLIIILVIFQVTLRGQTVNLRCTGVMPGGDVKLQWNPLTIDTSGFNNYTIYYSLFPGGPYIDSIVITDFSLDNYLHNGAGADVDPVYYYLITNKNSGSSPPSDTLATILLTASKTFWMIISFWSAVIPSLRSYQWTNHLDRMKMC